MLPTISPQDLAGRIARPDAPLVLDLCLPDDFAADPRLIPGAQRSCHTHVPKPDRDCVLVCQKGQKISQGAAAKLRAAGGRAAYLTGGMLAWHAAHLPSLAVAALPDSKLWVTRDDPQAGLVHWLLRRWISRDACLLVVPDASLADVADRFDAAQAPDAKRLLADAAIDCRALNWLIELATGDSALPSDLPALLTAAHALGQAGQPQDPALALLDLSYRAVIEGGAQ